MHLSSAQIERRRALFKICSSREELRDWVYFFLDLELPGALVDPDSNTTPLDMAWDCYRHFITQDSVASEVSRVLYYAGRDCGKTLTQSVLEVLALLHLDIDIVHLAAIEEQSRNASRYLKKFLGCPDTRDFLEGDNVRTTLLKFYRPLDPSGVVLSQKEFKELSSEERETYYLVENKAEIVVATVQSTNGKHSGIVCLDEIDVLRNTAAYAESGNIATAKRRRDGQVQMPLTILTSTRKSAFGLVQDEINRAEETGLVVKHYNVIDVTERCPPERHLPNLPKIDLFVSDASLKSISGEALAKLSQKEQAEYAKEESFAGCGTCKLHAACKGRLATHQTGDSRFLKPIQMVINSLRTNSIEMAQAQLLCRKPYSAGLIYPRFSKTRHVLSPARAYERILGELPDDHINFTKEMLVRALLEHEFSWRGGIDWGSTHNFVYIVGVKVHSVIYWIDVITIAGLEPDQMLDISEPFKRYPATVFGDTADPKMNKLFKKHGHKMVLKWNKGPGTVVGGINIVRAKLNPPLGGEPEMFFVQDGEDDNMMKTTIANIAEYHWKTGPDKKPTNIPDEDKDDECDATRYATMNTFDPKGILQTESQSQSREDLEPIDQTPTWLQTEIDNLIGAGEAVGEEMSGKSSRVSWDFS